MEIRPLSYYAREVRRELSDDVFAPAPARLWWLALHVAIVAAGVAIVAGDIGGWWGRAAVAIPLGFAFAGMAFVAHETLHGATTRHPTLRHLLGGIGFAPFAISPRHWVGWHNRMHHGHTMHAGVDPDAYPTLEHYERSLRARVADTLSPGAGRVSGVIALLIGLVGQSTGVLLSSGPAARYLSRRQYALALLETALALGLWIGLGVAFGWETTVFAWLIPAMLGNVIVMAYILTNHSLSPLTEINDPLANSLSVHMPAWFERYTLQFGLHVEHHLFPAVSGRHAGRIKAVLERRFPERYRNLPLFTALARLWATGRVYKDAHTLIDPRSGLESAVVGREQEVRVGRDHRPRAVVLPG